MLEVTVQGDQLFDEIPIASGKRRFIRHRRPGLHREGYKLSRCEVMIYSPLRPGLHRENTKIGFIRFFRYSGVGRKPHPTLLIDL